MAKTPFLAVACVAGLLAAPAFAATGSSDQSGTNPMPQTHHRTHSWHGSQRPDAQNSEVDRLNEQSLSAAQAGRPYNGESSGGGYQGGGMVGGMGGGSGGNPGGAGVIGNGMGGPGTRAPSGGDQGSMQTGSGPVNR